MKARVLSVMMIVAVVCIGAGAVHADKSDVEIDVPKTAVKGSTITVTLKVIHKGNNWFHYTDWLWVKINGKEVKRWDFTRTQRPEGAVFTRTVQVVVDAPLEITAQANCNLHGSVGQHSAMVAVQ